MHTQAPVRPQNTAAAAVPSSAALSAEQVAEVRRTWALVQPIRHLAAGLFYERLFDQQPALRRLFKGNLSHQGTMLMAALGGVVANLDRLDQLSAPLAALAQRHTGYGVLPEHYDHVGAALLWTLAQGLQQEFTPTAHSAWASAYGRVATAMKAAAMTAPTAAAASAGD